MFSPLSSRPSPSGASEALIYRYFGSKAELYTRLVRLAIDGLISQHGEALAELPAGSAARERIKATVSVYLDHIASHREAWAKPLRPGSEPDAVIAVRAEARRDHVRHLAVLLQPRADRRHDYALWGYLGFLDTACVRWVELGCSDAARWPLIEGFLGALEGALGDWDA